MPASRSPEDMLHAVLLGVVALSALPFGAYPDWAWGSMSVAIGVILAAWAVLALSGRVAVVRFPVSVVVPCALFVLVLAWASLQALAITPRALHHPLWAATAEALGQPYRGSISVDPAASWRSILRLATYTAVFWVAAQLGANRERGWLTLRVVSIAVAIYALYGLTVEFTGANRILWFEKTSYFDVVTSTFVNRNSFATYAGLGLICTTAMIRHRLAASSTHGVASLRLRLAEGLGRLPDASIYLAAWLLIATALLLSESRGGVAATIVALGAFQAILAISRFRASRRRRDSEGSGLVPRYLGAFALILAGAGVFAISGGAIEQRVWHVEAESQHRQLIYAQTIEAISDEPWLGTGAGTFAGVFDLYGTSVVGPGVRMAHNDYLEIALELGIPAAATLVFAISALAVICAMRAIRRTRGTTIAATGAAVVVLVGSHALVDFSLQLPAVAATFALVLGTAVGRSFGRSTVSRGGGESSRVTDRAVQAPTSVRK